MLYNNKNIILLEFNLICIVIISFNKYNNILYTIVFINLIYCSNVLLNKNDWPLRRVLHAINQKSLYEKVTTAGNNQQYLKPATFLKMSRWAGFPA